MPRKSFKRQNERRLELIDKKIDGGISEAESAELESIKEWVSDYFVKKYPIDMSGFDELERIKRRLEAEETAPRNNSV